MINRDMETYNTKICVLCTNYETCSKDKFKVQQIGDKTTMRCLYYDYKNKDQLPPIISDINEY